MVTNSKTKRYIQISIENNKIELYKEHQKDLRQKFFEEYEEQIKYICQYIMENHYYESFNYISKNNKLKVSSNILQFRIRLNNEIELGCSFDDKEKNELYDYFLINTNDQKLIDKIMKNTKIIENILKRIPIHRTLIPMYALEEIDNIQIEKNKKR